MPALGKFNCLEATSIRCARRGQRPVERMHAKVCLPPLVHFPFTFTYTQECPYDNHDSCLCFDFPSAVARLTVDRADAHVTPTCVFPHNNSEGFWRESPNIDLNKSRSFLFWLCSTHSWGGALASRNFTQDVPLHSANLPTKEVFGLYSLYPWSCNSGLFL